MEGLRHRMQSGLNELEKYSNALNSNNSSRNEAPNQAERSFDKETLKNMQVQVAPIFQIIGTIIETLRPFANVLMMIVNIIWQTLQPYHPEDLAVAVYGLILVFYGGIFMTLVASFEAAHQFGWRRIRVACSALYREWVRVRIALERDNKIDANRDGIADVKQMDPKDLAARRFMVFAKSVNPQIVSDALEGLSMATVAILATLRIRFARAITLGAAIGEVLHKIFSPLTTPVLKNLLSDDFEKWIPVINKHLFRYIGISSSWVLMRIVNCVFASMRGSSLLITGVCGYLVRYDYVGHGVFQKGNPVLIATWGLLSLLGIYWQLSSGFRLSFPMNLILFPITVAENIMVFVVGSSEK